MREETTTTTPMSASHPQIERLNYFAAALLTVAGIHTLFSLLSLPTAPATGEGASYAGIWRLLRIFFLCLGVAGGAAVAYFASFIINGRSLRRACLAAIGAMALPLLGPVGAITIFALLPLGIAAFAVFGRENWKSAFADAQLEESCSAAEESSQSDGVQGFIEEAV